MVEKWYHEESGERFDVEFYPQFGDRFSIRSEAVAEEGDWFTVVVEADGFTCASAVMEAAILEDPEEYGWLSSLWPVPDHLV